MWIVACALSLAAASTVPLDTTLQADASRFPSLEALRHYASGRLLEERGLTSEALGELYRALAVDPRAPALLREASEANLHVGEPVRALELADRALTADSADARAHWLRGAALFQLQRYPEAFDALQRAARIAPDETEYQRTRARAAEQLERWDEVADAWRHVLLQDNEDGEAWFQVGAAEGRLGHFMAADSALAQAEELNPQRPGLDFLRGLIDESLGRSNGAVDRFRRHLTLHPDDRDTRRRLVELLARSQRFDEAYTLARQVSRESPDDLEALEIEADLAYHAGKPADGRAVLDRMMRGAPEEPALVARAVGVLARNERAHEGAQLAQEWAQRHPADRRGVALAARAHAAAHDWIAAERLARAAIGAEPDSLGPRLLLGRIQQGSERWSAAESTWTDVLARFPDAPGVLLELAFCRERTGDAGGAEAAARDVLGREPDNATALNFLGYMFADRGERLEEALDLIQRAIALDPDNGAFIDSLGWVYYRLGRLEQARAELERALRLTQGDPEVHEHLGDVYKDLRLMDLAREQYRLALASNPTNPRVKSKLSELR